MLKELYQIEYQPQLSNVLILILMEHAQRDNKNMELSNNQVIQCLNPYFNGTCSKSGGYCVVNNNPYQS